MNSEEIYVEVPGELGWRAYPLDELVRLWRAGQLPRDARFQNERGEWQPVGELVDPIIEKETRAGVARGGLESADGAPDPAKKRWKRWTGVGLAVAAAVCLWPLARDRYAAEQARQQAVREALEWERQTRVEDFIKSERVVPGMTPEQVRRAKGPPRTAQSTGDGARERWVYRQQIVVFENGKVVGIETPK